MDDLSAQVALQQQLNKALQERTKLLEEHNKQLQTQSDLAAKIGDNLGNPRSSRRMRDMSSSIKDSSDSLGNAIDNAKNYDKALSDAADSAEETASSTSILSSAFSKLTSILGSVASGIFFLVKAPFKLLFGGFSGLIDILGTVAKGIFSLVKGAFGMLTSVLGTVAKGIFSLVTGPIGFLTGALGSLASGIFSLVKGAFNFLTGAISGLLSGIGSLAKGLFSLVKGALSGLFEGLKSIGRLALNVTSTLGKLAISILSFPFTMFDWLVSAAQEGGGGSDPLREAMEELRETLGDLASGTSKDVISSFKEIRKQGNMLGETGLSIRKVFGRGRQGMAEYLKDLTATLVATGDNLHRLSKQFLAMGGNLVVFQRGIGLSKEELAELGNIAEMRGQDIAKSFTEFGSIAIKTGKRFGIDVKDMAKGMKELNLDVENFGHLGPKAFAPITAYARKLGLEIKDMAGVMAKFSGFADTTEAASKLGQAFGMNVDSMQLMAAQNPAEKIDILRKSFFNAGKDLSKLNYQQRNYLSSLTGLQGKSLEAAFALDKQGVSYASMQEASEEANKSQMSQKEVMQELSKNIKRLIQSGGGRKFTSFFDAFFKGFERGILKSKEFRKVFKNIRSGLKVVHRLGILVGRAFVKYFPGVKKTLEALAEMFDPKKYEEFSKKALPIFEALFVDLDFNKFFDNISKVYKETFGAENYDKLLSGFDEVMTGLTKIAGQAMAKLIQIVMQGMLFIGKLILDPKGAIDSLKGGSGAIGGALSKYTDNLLDPTIEMIEKENEEGGLLGQLKETYSKIFDKFVNWLKTSGAEMLKSGWNSIVKWFSKGGGGEKAWETVKGWIGKLWTKAIKPMLDKLWEKVKAWWDNIDWCQVKTAIWNGLYDALMYVIESAWEWAKENPGKAALIFIYMFPKGSLKLATFVGSWLIDNFNAGFNIVAKSRALMGAAGHALKTIFGAVRTASLGVAGAISAPALAVGTAIISAIGTAYNANEIMNDPRLKKTGIGWGTAIGAGFFKTVTLGYDKEAANFLGKLYGYRDEHYSVDEILEHNAKLSHEATERMRRGTARQNKEALEDFKKAAKVDDLALANALRSGDQAAVSAQMRKQFENQIEIERKKIYADPNSQFHKDLAKAETHEAGLVHKKYARIARERAEANFKSAEVLARGQKTLKELIKREDLEKLEKAEAQAALLSRKSRVAETLKRLSNVPVDLDAALAGLKSLNTNEITNNITILGSELEKVMAAVNPITDTIDKVITTQGKFAKLATRLKSIDQISGTLNLVNIGKLPRVGPQISRFVKSLSRAAKAITDAEVKKVEPIVKAVTGFKGGKVTVQSNLPDKFDIHLNVEIEARQVANAVSKISLKPNNAGGYIQTGTERTNK